MRARSVLVRVEPGTLDFRWSRSVLELDGSRQVAINDVAIHRKVGERVAELASHNFGVEEETMSFKGTMQRVTA